MINPSKATTIWRNLNIATMASNQGYGIIFKGALVTKHNRIIWIGEEDHLPDDSSENPETKDGQGFWMTPSLIDCHTHLVYGGNRASEFAQRLAGVSYDEIARNGGGIISTVKATRESSPESLFISASKRLQNLLNEGVGTVEIKSGYGLDLPTELKMLGTAKKLEEEFPVEIIPTFLGAHAIPPEYSGRTDQYIDFVCSDVIPEITRHELAKHIDVFLENIAFTKNQSEKIFKKAIDSGLNIKLHCDQLSNMGGAELAAEYGALSVDHLEYLDENGIKAIAGSGTIATLLPGAFYFLREKKIPPIDLLRKYNVPIAIGSDLNPGSSPLQSLLLMLNMGCTFFNLTPEESFAGITRNAAKALGIEDKKGTLEIGKTASFQLWDIGHPDELSYEFGHKPITI